MIVGIVFGIAALVILLILAYVIWNRRKKHVLVVDGEAYDRYPNLHYPNKQGKPFCLNQIFIDILYNWKLAVAYCFICKTRYKVFKNWSKTKP